MTRRAKLGGALLLTAAAIITGLLLLRHWASHPADGAVRTGTPVVEKLDVFDEQTQAASVISDYFTANLPSGFKIKRQKQTPEGPTLLQLTATGQQQQIAITIAALPPGGLAETGSYNLRVKNTTSYRQLALPGLPPSAVAFETTEGPPAFVVFWPDGGRYAEIAFTGSGATMDQLIDSFTQTMGTWRWQ